MAVPQLNAPPRAEHGVPQAGVTHVRHRHTERFTVVGNHLAQHAELSAAAIGIAVYIQSKPDGASVTVKALAARFPEGEVVIARALRELEAAGYLRRPLVRLASGRRVTHTYFHDCPTHLATPQSATPSPAPAPAPTPKPAPLEPSPPPEPASLNAREAARLLASLRLDDSRLLLSKRDIARLTPALTTWLDRGIDPAAAVRTLTADLPPDPIRRPAGLIAYRLNELLPPSVFLEHLILGTSPPPSPRPDPLQNCLSCDRAFRSPTPGRCAECTEDEAEAAA
ncbi:hypothetical protein N566_11500 [Streptomycetaceae bacterium MP113-05]|nr:hypothetical protein N566_11500 [Streptomycetaceae bacterium MP113-05]